MPNTHPHYLYSDIVNSIKADKAVITAMTGLLDGTIAYATDTNEFGTYSLDTNTWTWVGASALLYVQDEGVPIGTPSTLNFVGNNVDVSISGTVARVFVTGSSGAVVGSSFDNFWNSGTQGNYSVRAKNDTAINAMGNYAFAVGQGSIASGSYSYAQGFQTKAINAGASAEGSLSVASGVNAHAEGNGSVASGNDSHAEGSGQSIGDTSHAEGLGTKAYGTASHAEGISTVASGTYSFAGGISNHSIGTASAALGGRNNRVLGNNSVVLGGSGTVGVADDTVFVPNLNVRYIQSGTPITNIGVDINGNLVSGTMLNIGQFSPSAPPVISNSKDDEFNNGVLNTGSVWGFWNPAPVSGYVQESYSSALIIGTSGSVAAKTLFGVYEALPFVPYSGTIIWQMGMTSKNLAQTGTNASYLVGLGLFQDVVNNPATSDLYTLNLELSSSGTANLPRMYLDRWSQYNTRLSIFQVVAGAGVMDTPIVPKYFKMEGYFVSGSDSVLNGTYMSQDGVNWSAVLKTAPTAAHRLQFTPQHVGLVAHFSTPQAAGSFDFIRFQNSGTFSPIYGRTV